MIDSTAALTSSKRLRQLATKMCGSATAALIAWSGSVTASWAEPAFDVRPQVALYDQVVRITLTGLPPNREVTIRAEGPFQGTSWQSSATFRSDGRGQVDLTRMAPLRGSYSGFVSPMGLFTHAQPLPKSNESMGDDPTAAIPPINAVKPAADVWRVSASMSDVTVATATLSRLPVAADVQMTAVVTNGLQGVFYRPAGEGPHPALLVLAGSSGGVLPPTGLPGGLASIGYAVLALAYFRAPGLPPTHLRIPLEYLRSGVRWLSQQEDLSGRIGVLGTSRGAELGLLLGAHFPEIGAVLAIAPSHVAWGILSRPGPPWTLGGNPIPAVHTAPQPGAEVRHAGGMSPQLVHRFLARLEDNASVEASRIRVERIQGPVLLVSGHEDRVWPATLMGDEIESSLRRNRFRFFFEHLRYPDTGHVFDRPYAPIGDLTVRGGTVTGTARAYEDFWRRLTQFLEQHLGTPARLHS